MSNKHNIDAKPILIQVMTARQRKEKEQYIKIKIK